MLPNKILTQPAHMVPYLNPIVIRAVQDSIAMRMRDLGIRHPGLFKGQYKCLLLWEIKLLTIPYVLIASSVSLIFAIVWKRCLTGF
jgi:hypothetical protein